MTHADNHTIQVALGRGLIQPADLSEVRAAGSTVAASPLETCDALDRLERSGRLDRKRLAQAIADETGLPFVDLDITPVPIEAFRAIPTALADRLRFCPVERRGESLRLAVADPLDLDALASVRFASGLQLEPCVATPSAIRGAIARSLSAIGGLAAKPDDRAGMSSQPRDGVRARDSHGVITGEPEETDATLIGRVNDLLEEGIRRGASDIHIEPLQDSLRVRLRIDGVLEECEAPPKRLHPAIVSRIKIMANLSIAEKRVPHDGRLNLHVGGRSLDLRVATLPTVHGESVVLRVLDSSGAARDFESLGMGEADAAEFLRIIQAPDGMVLITGPTGSGKTTTLYTALQRLNRDDRKILTVEDPIEFRMPGINQVAVNTATGMTFAAALRAMLRQAPNIVMVGEIRDRETAEIAVNAALTGHALFSTLHTNDATGAIVRLADLGARPLLLASALRAVVAQRLVRRVCPDCSEERAATPRERIVIGAGGGGARLRQGRGCVACRGSGFRGRIGIYEILPVGDALRRLVHARAPAGQLRAEARRAGARSLRCEGFSKVLAGHTTIDEVVAATAPDTPDDANPILLP